MAPVKSNAAALSFVGSLRPDKFKATFKKKKRVHFIIIVYLFLEFTKFSKRYLAVGGIEFASRGN